MSRPPPGAVPHAKRLRPCEKAPSYPSSPERRTSGVQVAYRDVCVGFSALSASPRGEWPQWSGIMPQRRGILAKSCHAAGVDPSQCGVSRFRRRLPVPLASLKFGSPLHRNTRRSRETGRGRRADTGSTGIETRAGRRPSVGPSRPTAGSIASSPGPEQCLALPRRPPTGPASRARAARRASPSGYRGPLRSSPRSSGDRRCARGRRALAHPHRPS